MDAVRTVAIVDDHSGFRAAARLMLEAEGWSVIAEAGDGPTALALVAALRPEIVLVDVHLLGEDGFAVAEDLAALPCLPVVVLVSSRDSPALRARVPASAAVGFIAKADLSSAAITALGV
jgi:DNA-binding NarL/FixJ family response regulator